MGMDHYLERPKVLPPNEFAAWSRDVRKVLDALPTVMIRGESGEGEPTTTDEVVAFSGNPHYAVGVNSEAVAIYRDPVRLAQYRVTGPDDWPSDRWNAFRVARIHADEYPIRSRIRGWFWDSFRTKQFPWDSAVTAALILFDYHFTGMSRVGSDYPYEFWQPGLILAKEATGRPLRFPLNCAEI